MTKISRNFIAGKMNKVVDERLVPNGEYVDAMNIRMGSTENSEIGVIENSKGNIALTSLAYIDATPLSIYARCIGALEDSKNETIYWFVHDPAFTPLSGSGTGKLDLILSYNTIANTLIYHVISIDDGTGLATTLNFNPSYLITGVDKIEDLLFFTDDYNPPRFINVKRSYAVPVGNIDYGGSPDELEEALLVIKRPPMTSPTIVPAVTAGQENFMEDRFICFAYRYKYADDEYSATSQWSEPIFFPKSFQFDLSSYLNIGMENAYNTAIITYNVGGPLVKGIDLLFKEMDSNVIKVIEKIDRAQSGFTSDYSNQTYSFTNSKIYTVLPESELLRLYDNVPLKAKAQTIMGNRLMYGNYVEGYDLLDKFGSPVDIGYSTNLISQEAGFLPLTTNTQTGNYALIGPPGIVSTTISDSIITVDLTPIISTYGKIPQGASINIDFSFIGFQWQGSGTYANPSSNTPQTDISFSFYTNAEYLTVAALAASPEFISAVGDASAIKPVPDCTSGISLTDNFNCLIVQNFGTANPSGGVEKYYSAIIGTIPNPDATAPPLGAPIAITTSGNFITLQLPAMAFADNASVTPPVVPVQQCVEYYTIVSHDASFQLLSNTRSLHSNRGYEIGIVYMDDFGRSSTVLVSKYNTEFVQCGKSDKQNSISVTIPSAPPQRAPYWAKKYKFVCRADKEGYETIYCPLYFNDPDNAVTYFLLEGENARKVEDGDRLIVKADSNGVPQDCVYATVLEKEAKPYNFITNSPEGSPPEGVYMKIRPDNFSTVKPSNSYIDLGRGEARSEKGGICASLANNFYQSYGSPYLCSLPHPTVVGEYIDIDIPAGSLVIIQIYFSRLGVGDGNNACEKRIYNLDLELRSSNNYASFYDFWIGENVGSLVDSGFKDVGGANTLSNVFIPGFTAWPNDLSGICDSGTNKYQFKEDTSVSLSTPESVYPKYLQVSGTTACSGIRRYKRWSNVSCRIQIYKADDACVFETMPSDTLPDVFFENNLSYDIDADGNHLGLSGDTDQDISLGIDGVINTGFFNCYSFGNGVESYKIRDSILGKTLNLGNRVNSVAAQDYKEADRFSDITYSGVYNPETNVNKLNEFNLGLLNYKNLEASFGDIYILDGRQTDILVLQEDKISSVLVEKNLLSDAAGGGALTSVPEVLGKQVARPEKYGISFNPESYVQWGYDRFFTDLKRGAVIQLRGDSFQNDQLKVISEMGMRTWFRDTFNASSTTQKLGGFDPYMNEYVLSGNEIEIPGQIDCIDCGIQTTYTLTNNNPDFIIKQFCVRLGNYIGNVDINYNVTGLIDFPPYNATVKIEAIYNGNTYTTGNITTTGSGTLSFIKDVNNIDEVVIKLYLLGGSTSVNLLVNCPIPEELTIIEVVYTDPVDAGLTTHTEFYYYHYTPSTYISALQSNFVVFEAADANPFISRYNSSTGIIGTAGFPAAGETMRLRNNQIVPDSFVFDPSKHKFMYHRSNTLYTNNIADVISLYGAATVSSPISGSSPLYFSDFTVPPSIDGQYLYLIWDLRTPYPVNLCYTDDGSAESLAALCCNCEPCDQECISLRIQNNSSTNTATIAFPSGLCDYQYLPVDIELEKEEAQEICVVNDSNWYVISGDVSITVLECGCSTECRADCETWTITVTNSPGSFATVEYTNCQNQTVVESVFSPYWRDICVLPGTGGPVVTDGVAGTYLGNICGCCIDQPCWYVSFTPDAQASIQYWDCDGVFHSELVDADSTLTICINKLYDSPKVIGPPGFKYDLSILNPCNCLRTSVIPT